MITLKQEKALESEIQTKIEIIREETPSRKVKRIEVSTEDETFVGYFTTATRQQYKNFTKKYKDDAMSVIEAIAESNIVYPSRDDFKQFADLNYGAFLQIGNKLFTMSGFDATIDAKNA
jgi:hypothetical protein